MYRFICGLCEDVRVYRYCISSIFRVENTIYVINAKRENRAHSSGGQILKMCAEQKTIQNSCILM